MAKQIEIYVGAPLEMLIGPLDTNSARINEIAERYLSILEHDMPYFRESEWRILHQAWQAEPDERRELASWPSKLFYDPALRQQYGKQEIFELARRVRQLTRGQLVALIEALRRTTQERLPPAEH
jgi:hypothetical protein